VGKSRNHVSVHVVERDGRQSHFEVYDDREVATQLLDAWHRVLGAYAPEVRADVKAAAGVKELMDSLGVTSFMESLTRVHAEVAGTHPSEVRVVDDLKIIRGDRFEKWQELKCCVCGLNRDDDPSLWIAWVNYRAQAFCSNHLEEQVPEWGSDYVAKSSRCDASHEVSTAGESRTTWCMETAGHGYPPWFQLHRDGGDRTWETGRLCDLAWKAVPSTVEVSADSVTGESVSVNLDGSATVRVVVNGALHTYLEVQVDFPVGETPTSLSLEIPTHDGGDQTDYGLVTDMVARGVDLDATTVVDTVVAELTGVTQDVLDLEGVVWPPPPAPVLDDDGNPCDHPMVEKESCVSCGAEVRYEPDDVSGYDVQ
jgi:hypothetical protein